jgi:DNA-binding GntR family transcriptional regulator
MSDSSRIELDRRSTPEQIARGLSRLVLSGELPPGHALREGAIATELGVSRNTVREAVRLLEHGGLVRYELNRGALVREPSQDDLKDVYRARLAIEVGAAWTADGGDAAGVLVIEALNKLRTALAKGRTEDTITADLEFHATLVAAAGSTRLSTAFSSLLNELRLYLTVLSDRNEYEDVDRVAREHGVIADAFTSRNRERLAAEVTQHIVSNAARVSAILEAADR